MDTLPTSSNVVRKEKNPENTCRMWTLKEEEALLQALKAVVTSGWKSENGFKCGYLGFLEEAMKKVFPRMDLRGNPHINSKIHVWKTTHGILMTMLNRSGIGWNSTENMIEATDEACESFVKADKSARTMRNKSWPYYNDWCEIFWNDRATREHAESFAAAVQDVLNFKSYVTPDYDVGLDELFRAVEGEGDSMSVSNPVPSIGTTSKKSIGKKRKMPSQEDDLFYDAINNFTDMTRVAISDFVTRMSQDYEVMNAKKEVFEALGRIPELTKDERGVVAEFLVDNQNKLTLFFSLPDEDRLSMVMRILKSI